MVSTRIYHALLALIASMFTVGGCSDGGPEMIPIRGEVLYNGTHLKEGMVVYLPKGGGTTQQASGRIQANGTFELTTSKKGDGVRIGEYHIIVQAYSKPGEGLITREQTESGRAAPSKPQLIIPKRYIDPVNSELEDTVNSDHSGFKRIELTD